MHKCTYIYNYIFVPSLLCAEMVWAELVMCRVGYVLSLLCAELTRHPEMHSVHNNIQKLHFFHFSQGMKAIKVIFHDLLTLLITFIY